MLDLGKLIALREVSLQGSMTGAAQSLRITVSAVSQQIAKLENDLEVALLEPLGRGVQLTSAAHELIAAAETALASLEEAESELRSRGTATRTLRIAAFHSFTLYRLRPLLNLLTQTAPHIRIEAIELDPIEAINEVSSRRADIAIIDEYPGIPVKPTQGLVKRTLCLDPIGVYLPRGLELTPGVDPIVTAQEQPWSMELTRTDSFLWARSICRGLGFEPQVAFESPDFQLHAELVHAGKSAAFLPESILEMLPFNLEPARGFPTDLRRELSIVIRRGTQHRSDLDAAVSAIGQVYDGLGARLSATHE